MAAESVVLLTLVLATGVFCQQDRTIVAGESGADVVQAVLAKLEYSNVFTSSSDMCETIFMQRMAYVETRDGTEPHRDFQPQETPLVAYGMSVLVYFKAL